MKVLDSIKRTMESIEADKQDSMKVEDHEEFAELFEKHSDIPKEKLVEIIDDVKEKLAPAPVVEDEGEDGVEDELVIQESDNPNKADVEDVAEVKPSDVEHTDANKEPVTHQVNELDASEDEDNIEDEEVIVEDDADFDDEEELVVSEEGEEVEDEVEDLEEIEEDEDFDIYKDELDIVDGDEKNEDAEKIDMNIPEEDNGQDAADRAANENAEKIDLNIPEKENSDDAADAAAKEHANEDNNGAKAAIANRDNKGAFSSDIDALTDYLDKY